MTIHKKDQNAIVPVSGSGGGGKSGKGGSGQGQNTLRSDTIAKWIDLISDGPIGGLVTGNAQSIYFNNVPVQNLDGTYNYSGFGYSMVNGTPDQAVLPGFTSISDEFPGSGQITADVPGFYTTNAETLDRVIVTIEAEALVTSDSKTGQTKGSSVEFQIWVQAVGGQYVLRVQDLLSGETSSPYDKSYDISVSSTPGPYNIKVVRLTQDSTSFTTQNTIVFKSVTEIIDHQISYEDSAVVGCVADTEVFGASIPARQYLVNGLLIEYPSNYDPGTRIYAGIWDGLFQTGMTNNPAWVLWALATNTRWGLGLDTDYVDKYELYQVAQYCDQLVPDGFGGHEPRFTFNGQITQREDAFKVLQSVASVFRGILFYGAGSIIVRQNGATNQVWKSFSLANISGDFSYASTARKARHNRAVVKWIDPSKNWVDSYQLYEDRPSIIANGVYSLDLTAYGCTSQGQAWRYGAWAILTEQMETETVQFQAGFDAYDLLPGDIIEIADPQFAPAAFAGRLLTDASTNTVITLDREVTIDAGDNPQINLTLLTGAIENTTEPQTINRQVVYFTSPVLNTPGTTNKLQLSTPIPNGYLGSASAIIETTDNGIHGIAQTFYVTPGLTYSGAIYVKDFGSGFAKVWLTDTQNSFGLSVNLQTGAEQTFAAGAFTANATLQTLANGWYRIVVTVVAVSSTLTIIANAQNGLGVDSYAGDGSSGIAIFGATFSVGGPVDYVDLRTLDAPITNGIGNTNLCLHSEGFNTSEAAVSPGIVNTLGQDNGLGIPIFGGGDVPFGNAPWKLYNAIVSAGACGAPGDPPIMWVLSTNEVTPAPYRVLSIEEKDNNLYQVIASQYNAAKFPLIDETQTLDINQNTSFGSAQDPSEIPPPTNFQVSSSSAFTSGTIQTNVSLSWTPPATTFLKTYMVGWQKDAGQWTWVNTNGATSWKFTNLATGNYVFGVYCIAQFGIKSINVYKPVAIGVPSTSGDTPASTRTPVYNLETNLGGNTYAGVNMYMKWNAYPLSYLLGKGSFQVWVTSGGGALAFNLANLSAVTCTVEGSFQAGDAVTLSIQQATINYRVVAGDTNNTIATKIANLMLADTSNSFAGTSVSANVINIDYHNPALNSEVTNDGTSDPFFNQFIVEVFDITGTTSLYADKTTHNSYTFTQENNQAINLATFPNLALWSQEHENAVWNKAAVTVSADAGTAPDGTFTADKIVCDTSNGFHSIDQTISITSGSTVVGSWFLRAGEIASATISLINGSHSASAAFDLNFGVIIGTPGSSGGGTFTNVQGGIVPVPHMQGWYRCYLTATANAVASVDMQLQLETGSFQGDGVSGLYAFGAGFEVGQQAPHLYGASQATPVTPVGTGPFATTVFAVAVEDTSLGISNYTAEIINPQGLPSQEVTLSPTSYTVALSFTPPTSPNYGGIAVWLSTVEGFTPSNATLVYYDAGQPVIQVNPASTYYIIYAFFSKFQTSNFSYSSVQTVTTPAATITNQGQLATSGLTQDQVNNTLVATGTGNRVPYAQFEKGSPAPWTIGYNPNNMSPTMSLVTQNGLQTLQLTGTAHANGDTCSAKSTTFTVTPGEQLAVQALLSTDANTTGYYLVNYVDSAGHGVTATPATLFYTNAAFPTTTQEMLTVPPGARKGWIEFYAHAIVPGSVTLTFGLPNVTGVANGQTVYPAFVQGVASDPGADVTASNPLPASNRIIFSLFEKGVTTGWVNGVASGATAPSSFAATMNNWSAMMVTATASAAGQQAYGQQAGAVSTSAGTVNYQFPVTPGETICVQSLLSTGANTVGFVDVLFYQANGTFINDDEEPTGGVGIPAGSTAALASGFIVVPPLAAYGIYRFIGQSVGAGTISVTSGEPMVCSALAGQTSVPTFNPGANAVPGGDVTLVNTSAAVVGQQPWATTPVTYSTTAPVSPHVGDIWINTSRNPNVQSSWSGAAWIPTTSTNTNQLTDGANLGQTATWTGVGSKPANVGALTGSENINNSQIAVNGSGLIQGIGTGNGTAVGNGQISINNNGTLNGAGGGQVTLPGLGAGPLATAGSVTTELMVSGSVTNLVFANVPGNQDIPAGATSGQWQPLCFVNITTSGYPVVLNLNFLYNSLSWNVGGGITMSAVLARSDGATLILTPVTTEFQKATGNGALYGTAALGYIDQPSAGSWQYYLYGTVNNGASGSIQGTFSNAFLSALELKR